MYSVYTSNLKSGPRRQFGPRRSPERFWGFHRVIGPIRPYGNTHLHLGRSFGKTGYVVNGNFCCINRYTRTRIASRPSRAIQLYIAIQCYTLYSYTSLYSIQTLQHPSARRTGRVSWHLVARGSTRESWRWGGGLRLHLPSLHPPEIVVPSHDQDRHVELIVASCLFAACGRSQLHFMAAYLYHAVAKGL